MNILQEGENKKEVVTWEKQQWAEKLTNKWVNKKKNRKTWQYEITTKIMTNLGSMKIKWNWNIGQ